MRRGGIVLCGGQSSRMGQPKAWLPFGAERMLQRITRLLGEVVDELVVVAAPGQALPPHDDSVRIVHDAREGRGPLEGLLAGLRAAGDSCDAAYVTSCDVPFLSRGFVERMFELLGDDDIAVPRVDDFHHPLAAVYRPRVADAIERLLIAGRMRPVFLFEENPTRIVRREELLDVDPQLATLRNLNRPEEYLAALADAGLTEDAADAD